MSTTGLSAYELERERNIAANKAELIALGIEAAVEDVRTKKLRSKAQKRERQEKPPPPKPTRSSRSQGPAQMLGAIPAELDDRTFEGDDGEIATVETLKRASRAPRLTADQMARLNLLEPVSAAPLTEADLGPLERARADLQDKKSEGGWKSHKAKGTSLYGEKRDILRAAAPRHGLRWPTWLGAIEGALPPMGTTAAARDQTMFSIERAACGLGLDYKGWPDGVGVLLANVEDAEPPPLPRLLTLGSDTEQLRREGQRLEARYGRDAGNGWAYNHALGKLRMYQEMLLQSFDPPEKPSAASIFDLEEAASVAEDEEEDDEESQPLDKRRRAAAPEPTASPSAETAMAGPAFAFNQEVEYRRGDAWVAAVIDNIDEDEGTFDLAFEDGESEENVPAELIRARSA